MIDGTEKPKNPSNSAKRTARYNEFRYKMNLLFKLSDLNLNFALTLGYLDPALNNSALIRIQFRTFDML